MRALRLQQALRELIPAYAYDFRRYLRHSSSTGPYGSQQNLRSKITATYHNLEKGLSLPDPRPGFGAEQVARLLRFVDAYVGAHGWEEWLAVPVGVIRAYHAFNQGHDTVTVNDPDIVRLLDAADRHLPRVEAGTKHVRSAEVRADGSARLDFFTSRSSVRQYADTPVDPRDIEFAARAAATAPAVCNRQYGRAYVYTDRARIDAILEVQGGARGFGHELGGLAVITADLRNFWSAGERNQAFIDGGMYAMNFMLGLHARGLGAVPLNWSKTPEVDRRLRSLVELPQEAVVVTLIGFGVLREQYEVAASHRPPLGESLEIR